MISINLYIILGASAFFLISGIALGWILGKHLRPTYTVVALVGVIWFFYSIYTIERGLDMTAAFDWVGAACLVQTLGLEIGLIGRTIANNVSKGSELYSKIKTGK